MPSFYIKHVIKKKVIIKFVQGFLFCFLNLDSEYETKGCINVSLFVHFSKLTCMFTLYCLQSEPFGWKLKNAFICSGNASLAWCSGLVERQKEEWGKKRKNMKRTRTDRTPA